MPPDDSSSLDRTAVVIANPHARDAVPPDVLEAAAGPIRARGWHVVIEATSDHLDARLRAQRHARAGVAVLLACGGDGSLLPILNGVRDAGETTTAVGLIPAGTANVWAAEVGIPRDLEGAFALLETGERERVDLGVARIGDGEPVRFLLVCGAGLDGAVVEAVERRPHWKRRLGRLAFGPSGLAALAGWPPIEARLTYDDEDAAAAAEHAPQLLLALASNTSRYGGVATLTRRGEIDDGLLEITTFEGDRSLVARLALAIDAMRGSLDERDVEGVRHRQASRVTITPTRTLPVQVDGESLGRCGPLAPLHIAVECRVVTMILGAK